MKTGKWCGRRFLASGLAFIMICTLSAGAGILSHAEEGTAAVTDGGIEESNTNASGDNYTEGSGDVTEENTAGSNTPDNNIPDSSTPDEGTPDGNVPDENVPGDNSGAADDEAAAPDESVSGDDESHAGENDDSEKASDKMSEAEEAEKKEKNERKEEEVKAQSEEELPSGTCGDNLTWKLEKDSAGKYTLIIEGSGDMYENYTASKPAEWVSYNPARVHLPQGLTSIAPCAFMNCKGLLSINIPDSVTKIGMLSFRASGLKEVVIPGSVAQLDNSAFQSCTNLSKIKICDGVKNIGASCFSGNKSLREIEIPASVESIGKNALQKCDALETIYYRGTEEQWNALVKASDKTLAAAVQGKTIKYDGEVEETTYNITTEAYAHDRKGIQISEPGGTLTCSADKAKAGEKVTLNLSADEGYNIVNIRVHEIAAGTEHIYIREWYVPEGDFVFEMPANDVKVFLCLRSNKCGADKDGSNLTWSITKKPESGLLHLDIEGTGGMYDYVEASLPWGGYRQEEEGDYQNIASVSLPDGITSISTQAFYNCINLKEINFPDSLRSLGHQAFMYTALPGVRIPADALEDSAEACFAQCGPLQRAEICEGAVKMNGYLFSHCKSLKEIVIPASMSSIDYKAFEKCDALDTVYYGGTEEQWKKLVAGAKDGNEALSRKGLKVICGYTVTVESDGNGTASANVDRAAVGEKVKLTASPSKGYRFKKWQVISGGVKVKDNSFTMPGGSVTLKAVFEKIPVVPGNGQGQTSQDVQNGTGGSQSGLVTGGGAVVSSVVSTVAGGGAAAGGPAADTGAKKADASKGKKKAGEEKDSWFNTGLWSGSSSSQDKAVEKVKDEPVPLAGNVNASWALLNMLLAVCTALASGILIAGSLRRKQKGHESGNIGGMQLMSLIPAAAAIAVFFLTEDMGGSMVFADRHTWMTEILAAVQAAICVLARPQRDDIADSL